MANAAIDIAGKRFGCLTVVRRVVNETGTGARWLCKCDCGGTAEPLGHSLRGGLTRSCGCLLRKARIANGKVNGSRSGAANGRASAKHGHARTHTVGSSRTYRSWEAMKQRCTNRKHTAWQRYGGRGIKVCDAWLNSFEAFLADMGERPPGMSLDRHPDPDGNYEPSNCRWATREQQRANQSITYQPETPA